MIKKIVTLAVGFVFAFVAIFFSVREEVTADGKGSGKDTAVKNPAEFGEILKDLPDSTYYEAIMLEEMAKKADKNTKSLAAVADDGDLEDLDVLVTPVTLYEKTALSTENRTNASNYETITGTYLNRLLTIYYGKDAVYYDSVGTLISTNKSVRGSSGLEGSTRNTTTTTLDFDAHLYIGKGGAFFKFNKWEQSAKVLEEEYKNNRWVEVKDDDDDDKEVGYEQKIAEEIAKSLRKNYGKWINLYSEDLNKMPDLDDIENPDFDESDIIANMGNMVDYLAKVACAEIAEQYYEQLISTNEGNKVSFEKYAEVLNSYKESAMFEKSGNMYKMTDLGKVSLLAMFNWYPSSNSSSTPGVDECYFVIDMSDKKAPALFTNIDYYVYSSSSEGDYHFSKSDDFKMRDEIGVRHINNTVVPHTPNTKNDMYTLFGDAVKKIITTSLNSTSSLLVDGLNGAMEVIG